MSQQELLTTVARTLTELGIDFMLTGSFASSLQGEPRSTHDIDLVVALKQSHIEPLLARFSAPDYYLDDTSMCEAIQNRSMFNLLDIQHGDKVDFWLLKTDDFDQSRFARRQRTELASVSMHVSSPEDTILAKLNWARMSGGSEKQFGDAMSVYEVQFATLDQHYLSHWSRKLGVEPLWQRLQDEADVIEAE